MCDLAANSKKKGFEPYYKLIYKKLDNFNAKNKEAKNLEARSGGGLQDLSGWLDSNQRPLRPERSALPGCATSRILNKNIYYKNKKGNHLD